MTYKVEVLDLSTNEKNVVFENVCIKDFQAWFKGKYNLNAVAHPDMKHGVYRPRDKKGNAVAAVYVTSNQ